MTFAVSSTSLLPTTGNLPSSWTSGVLKVKPLPVIDEFGVQVTVDTIGLETPEGEFISLQDVANAGEMVGLFFPLTNPGSPELVTMINKLMTFIGAHANGTIAGGMTCC